MVSAQSVNKQLKKLKFNTHGWGRAEVNELPGILMPEELIYECVNGIYEGGFALLVATDSRVLLIDKKPLNYLTVEDLRFDMINELDYSHRLIGAQISISAGSKILKFKSYNQPRLRKLISHIQHCMAEGKKQESSSQQDQKQHLEQINQQLQAYLIAQHQQHEALRKQLDGQSKTEQSLPEPAKPSPELADFLFAQSLLKQYREQEKSQASTSASVSADALEQSTAPAPQPAQSASQSPQSQKAKPTLVDLYQEGMQEIFGRQTSNNASSAEAVQQPAKTVIHSVPKALEINPLTIAYSKLPMALRNRRFGRPSFHAHSRQMPKVTVSSPVRQPFTAQ